MRIALLCLLLLAPGLAQEDEIKVRMEPNGTLRLENPPAREVELSPTLSRSEPPEYTIYSSWPWYYDPWNDPGWLYLYGQYPDPYGPGFRPGPEPWLTPFSPWW